MPRFFNFTEYRYLQDVFNEQAAKYNLCIAPAGADGRKLKSSELGQQHHRGVFARRNVTTWKGVPEWVAIGRYEFEGIQLYAKYYAQYIGVIEPILARYEMQSGRETFITKLTQV